MSRWDEYDEEPPREGFWSTLVNFSSWAFSLIAVGLVGAFFLIVDTQRPGPAAAGNAAATVVVVPRGAGLGAIGEHLQAEGVVRSAIAFRGATLLYGHGRSLKAGEYAVPARASVGQIIEMLAQGKVLLHPITIPEGWTSGMIVDMLAASDVLDGPAPEVPAEGSLLPETY
ncbi:MAG: endolytic transglycosylase MltG, partial [Hyphomonadaceae bacterium]